MNQMQFVKKVVQLVRLGSRIYIWEAALESFLCVLDSIGKMLLPAVLIACLQRKDTTGLMILIISVIIVICLDKGYVVYRRKMDDKRILLNVRIEQILSLRVQHVEYSRLEDPEFLDLKAGASYAISSHKAIQNALAYITNFINAIGLVIVTVSYLVVVNPILLVFLILGMLGQTWIAGQLNGKLENFFKSLYSINRKFDWFNSLKTDLVYQKDIRLFRMEQMITRKIEDYNMQTTSLFGKMNDVTFRNAFGVSFVNYLTIFLCYLICGLNTYAGILGPKLSIGQFIVCISMTNSLNTVLSGIADDITAAFQMLGYLKPVVQLIDLSEERVWGDKLIHNIESIVFRNVSFKYPGTDECILKNVSFRIEKGEKIALVGLNGAGKSTVVKLLCGLYAVTEGEIFVNERNIHEYSFDSYMSTISVLLQDYQIYDFTVEENIAMSSLIEKERVSDVVEIANLSNIINHLPLKLETNLSLQMNEEGISLSGGERQRVALARAVYKNGSMFIFDEPTASLDPVAEYEVYKKYAMITKGKTCIYISHRMATTQFCDKIIVLENGKIIESGTHVQLMKEQDSLYRKLYEHQRKKFEGFA